MLSLEKKITLITWSVAINGDLGFGAGEVLLGMATATSKPATKNTEKRDFKSKQMKKVDTAISNVKYKNKKRS